MAIKKIDIKELVASKKPVLAKWIPNFVYRGLGKLIHINEINDFLEKNGDKQGLDYAAAMVEYLNLTFDVEGIENLPSVDERCIFASNHPFGGPDGIALIALLGNHYTSIKFPVNDFLMKLQNLNNVFVPINKHGALGRNAVRELERVYASDSQIIIFPAGLVSRKIKGVIQDLEWKKHFIAKAVEYKRAVVPIRIHGQNSKFFYNFALWRRRLKIPVNLEMLLLPHETFIKRGLHLKISIGKPIPYTEFVGKDYSKVAEDLRTAAKFAKCVAFPNIAKQ